MRKSFSRAVMIASAVGIVAVSGISTAQAGIPRGEQCPDAWLCVWTQDDHGVIRNQVAGNNRYWSTSWSMWNNDESWWNNTAYMNTATVVDGNDFYGRYRICIPPNSGKEYSYGSENNGQSNFWLGRPCL